jgi:hypothetical protein
VSRRPDVGAAVVVACLVEAMATTQAEGPRVRRDDGKAYHVLKDARRLPKLDRGDVERTLPIVQWRPLPRQADDPARAEPESRRQILDATCDAELVVLARVESAVPFQHPNGRWVLTAHDLAVTRVVRARDARLQGIARVRYVHPSGRMTVANRDVSTTLARFPALTSDEEGLFFLIGIGGGAYRTSLLLPPMSIRGGVLDPFGPTEAGREAAVGVSAREAARAAANVVCRPPKIEPKSRPVTRDGRLPPLGLPSSSPP